MKTLSNSPLKGEDSGSQVSPLRGNCPLEAEQLGSVSDGGPKGLEGSLPCCYLAPVSHYSAYYRADEVQLEVCDNFEKQTLRNRCWIDSPNGPLALTVPVVKTEGKTQMRDVRISDHGNWRHQHWMALESSYRQSPFFEYYADDFAPFYEKKWEFLADYNEELMALVASLLDIEKPVKRTGAINLTEIKNHHFGIRNFFVFRLISSSTFPVLKNQPTATVSSIPINTRLMLFA